MIKYIGYSVNNLSSRLCVKLNTDVMRSFRSPILSWRTGGNFLNVQSPMGFGAIFLDKLTSDVRILRKYSFTCSGRLRAARVASTANSVLSVGEQVSDVLYLHENFSGRQARQRTVRQSWLVCNKNNLILLGLVLERIERCTIRKMNPGEGFAFSANPESTAATENCTWRHSVLCGEVHDDNCHALQGPGHAGLFGTADAVLDYSEALLTHSAHSNVDQYRMQSVLASSNEKE